MPLSSAKRSATGRPRVDAAPVNVRLPPEQLASLDAWIAQRPEPRPSRPEAIRQCLQNELRRATNKKPKTDQQIAEENNRTTPIGLFNFADSYLLAATIILGGKTKELRFEAPLHFLLYHAAEL